jgi:hypothetical protein
MRNNYKKLIIYLDQWAISNIIKALNNHEQDYYYRLYNILHQGFTEEKLICPMSYLHLKEGSLNTFINGELEKHFGYMGQVEFFDPNKIKSNQIYTTAKKYANLPMDYPIWEEAFKKNPDTPTSRFELSVKFQKNAEIIRKSRERSAKSLQELKAEIHKTHIDFRTQLELEIQAIIDYLDWYELDNLKELLQEKLSSFLSVSVFKEIPFVKILSCLYANELVNFNDRACKTGDHTDFLAVAAYLPYSNFFTADTHVKNLIISNKLDLKYGVKVFCPRDINSLCEYLENTLNNLKPAYIPALTLCVIAPNPKKVDSVDSMEFCRMIRRFIDNKPNVEVLVLDPFSNYKLKFSTFLFKYKYLQVEVGIDITSIIEEKAKGYFFSIIIDRKLLAESSLSDSIINYLNGEKDLFKIGYSASEFKPITLSVDKGKK